MRLLRYLIQERKAPANGVKITRAQADEIEMAYETMIEDGRIKIAKIGSSYYISET